MKVGLTGASGLLGGNVAHAARDAGHAVICTRRASSRVDHLDGLGLSWVDADLSDADALARAFDRCDLVVHCAARTSVLARPTPELVRDNVDGTRVMIEACVKAGVPRLLHVSSTVAVGVSPSGELLTEDAPWNLPAVGLDDGYAITKRDAEQLVVQAVQDGRIDAVIVNPGFLFGPFDVRPSSGAMILEVAAGRARVFTRGRNCFVDARRVADGVLLAAARGTPGRRYILGGENLTYGAVFERIGHVVGRPPPKVLVPRWLARPAGWYGDARQALTGVEQPITSTTLAWAFHEGFVFSSERARRELGWDPGSLDAGIEAAWAWLGANGRA